MESTFGRVMSFGSKYMLDGSQVSQNINTKNASSGESGSHCT